jgi:undecaprenyl-diphosphatase
MVEAAKRHPGLGCLACAAGFLLVLVLAYWVAPSERLDRQVLDALSTRAGSPVNGIANVGFEVVDFTPSWLLAGALAFGIALLQGRVRDAIFSALLISGAGVLDLALKALLSNPRYHPVPVHSDAYPWPEAFPSGHSAGSLAISLAFLAVVPPAWRRPTAITGLVFTLYISFGVIVLNFHYPSDVLAGWLLTGAWWFGLTAIFRRTARRRPSWRRGRAGRRPSGRRVPSGGRAAA